MKLKYYLVFLGVALFCFMKKGFSQESPVIYLIGDSTMADKKDPEINPEHGWGQVLPEYLNDKIKVHNHAVNGRSTKSFLDEGRWQQVLDSLKEGDYVFIQFGHNDQKIMDSTRYTFPYTQYRYNLEQFVKESREKGAIPVLMTSIVRRNFNEYGVLVDTHGEYPLVVRMVALEWDVPFIDMQYLTERLVKAKGPENSKNLYLHYSPGEVNYYPDGKDDDTHLSYLGAQQVALAAINALIIKLPNFKSFLKNNF